MNPTISIITVTYNCEKLIRATIESVLEQTYPNIEYILIDGNSKDTTLSIINEYQDRIATIVSEPDKGLYDAMNKGQRLATGDFIWFVNAGDNIHSPTTVEQMIQYCDEQTDILYGEVMMVDQNKKPIGTRSDITTQKTPKNLHWKSLKYGMVVSHQGFLPRISITQPYMKGNLAADIDWVIQALKQSKKNQYVPLVLADFEIGGTSRQHHKRSLKNRFVILQAHYGTIPNLWNHGIILVRAVWYKITGKSKY